MPIYIVLLPFFIVIGIMVMIMGSIAWHNGLLPPFKMKDYPGRDAFMLRKTWDALNDGPTPGPDQPLDPLWLDKVMRATMEIPKAREMRIDDPPIMTWPNMIPLIPEGGTAELFKKLTEEKEKTEPAPKPVLRAFDFKEV